MSRYKGMSIPYYQISSDCDKTTFLKYITLNFGGDGFCVIVNLDRLILSGRYGYYIPNGTDILYRLREITGVSTNIIRKILEHAVEKDYYSEKIFLKDDIITNIDLAKNFIKECKNRKGFREELNRICRMFDLKEDELLPKKRSHYNIENLKPFNKKKLQIQEETSNKEDETITTQEYDEDIFQTNESINGNDFNGHKLLLRRRRKQQ